MGRKVTESPSGRFAEEYKDDPDRGYGMAVMTVFKKLLRPKCRDVFEPAREQFNGKGSYGNGGAMRVASISLAYPNIQDVKKVPFDALLVSCIKNFLLGCSKGPFWLGHLCKKNGKDTPAPAPGVVDGLPLAGCRIGPVQIWWNLYLYVVAAALEGDS